MNTYRILIILGSYPYRFSYTIQKGVMNFTDRNSELSNVTQAYLKAFCKILNTMIRRMTSIPLLCSISDTFIQQMIPHHLAAIEMSRNILKYTTNLELQSIATNIISAQTKSISNMQAIQCKCRMLTNTDFERYEYMKRFEKIAQTMFEEMGSATVTNGVNANFVREMIPHHEGAVRCPIMFFSSISAQR